MSVDFISTVWSTVASRFCSISLSAVSLLVAAKTFFRNYGIKDKKKDFTSFVQKCAGEIITC